MNNRGSTHWEKLCRESAANKKHILIEEECEFLISNSRINYTCSKCGLKAIGTSIRGYLKQKSSGCGFCNKEEGLMFNPPTAERLEKRKKTLEKKGYAKPLLGKKGALHPTFKGGVRFDYEASPLWREAVRINFNGRCFLTGVKENCNAHHLQSCNINPDLRNEPLNGVLITEQIHKNFHFIYGGGNNTVQQFEEFCKKYFNVHTFPWTTGFLKFKTLADLDSSKASTREERCLLFFNCVNKRNHEFKCFSLATEDNKRDLVDIITKEVQYKTAKNTYAVIFCKKHKVIKTVLIWNYLRTVHGLSCCAKEASRNVRPEGKPSEQELKQQFLLDVKKKGHIFKNIIGGVYKSAICTQVLVYCPMHKTEETPTIRNYMRNYYGTCCCKKNIV